MPIGPGAYTEQVAESRDLSPEMSGGRAGSWSCPKLQEHEARSPALCPWAAAEPHSLGCSLCQNTPAPRLSRLPAPILPLHPSVFWGFASPGKVCPWVWGRAVGYHPTTKGLGRAQPHNSACGNLPGPAGLQQLLLKKDRR